MSDSGNCSTSDEFTILLEGGRPWGFTLQGGADFRSPLKIAKVTNGGRAQRAGLISSDIITSINGIPTAQMKHHEAQRLIASSKTTLELVCTKSMLGVIISPKSVTQGYTFNFPESNGSSKKSNTLGHNRQRSLDFYYRPRATSDAGKRATVGTKIAGITVPAPPKSVRKLSEPNIKMNYEKKEEKEEAKIVAETIVPKSPPSNGPNNSSEDTKMDEPPTVSENNDDVASVPTVNDTPIAEPIEQQQYIKVADEITYDFEFTNVVDQVPEATNEATNEPKPDNVSVSPDIESKIFEKVSEDKPKNDDIIVIDVQSNGAKSPEIVKTGKNDDWYKLMFQSMKKGVEDDLPNKKPVWDRSPVPARKSLYEFESKISPNYRYKNVSYVSSAQRRLSESSLPSFTSSTYSRPLQQSSSGSSIGAYQKKADVVSETSSGVVYQKNIRKYNQSRNYWKSIERQASQERIELEAKRNSLRRTSSASSSGVLYSPQSPDDLNSPSEETTKNKHQTSTTFFEEEVVSVLSAGFQTSIAEEDTKQSSVSPVSEDNETETTMSKLHPLLKDMEDNTSDCKPMDGIPQDSVFSRIDASKLSNAIGNASVLGTMSQEGVDPLTLQVAAMSMGKEQPQEKAKSPAKKKKSKTTKPPPGKKAKVNFDFNATGERELSLKKGDVVDLTEQIDNNWLKGEFEGKSGMFPFSYVQVLTPEEISLMEMGTDPTEQPALNQLARAKHDFPASTDKELALTKGDIVTVLKSIDENWYEVGLGDTSGIVPKSYIEIVELEDALQ